MSQFVIDQTDDVAEVAPALLRDGFNVTTDFVDGRPELRLSGELDMATAPRLGRALNAALDAKPAGLALDLAKLSFVDSTGIRVLFDACRRARSAGCTLVLRSPSRSVHKALRLTRIDLVVAIETEPSSA